MYMNLRIMYYDRYNVFKNFLHAGKFWDSKENEKIRNIVTENISKLMEGIL